MGKERQTRGRMAISLGIKYEAATHGQIHLVRVLASTGLRAPIGPRKVEYPTWDAGSLFIVVLQRWGVALPSAPLRVLSLGVTEFGAGEVAAAP